MFKSRPPRPFRARLSRSALEPRGVKAVMHYIMMSRAPIKMHMTTPEATFMIKSKWSSTRPLKAWVRDDQASLTHAGVVYEYTHNRLQTGHKPIGWSLLNSQEYNLHCQAHGCCTGAQYFIDANDATIIHGSHVRFKLHTREIVQTSGGGYRPEARVKWVEFRAARVHQR